MSRMEVSRVLEDAELGPAAKLAYWTLFEVKREVDHERVSAGKEPADYLVLSRLQLAGLLGRSDARTVDTWLDALRRADLVSVSPGDRRGALRLCVFGPYPGRREDRPDPQLPLRFGEEPGVCAQEPPQKSPQEPPDPDGIPPTARDARDRSQTMRSTQSNAPSEESVEGLLLQKLNKPNLNQDEHQYARSREYQHRLAACWTGNGAGVEMNRGDELLLARLAWLFAKAAINEDTLHEAINRTRWALDKQRGRPGALLQTVMANLLFGNPQRDRQQTLENLNRLVALLRQVHVPRQLMPKRREPAT
jgi:hypothetical protein